MVVRLITHDPGRVIFTREAMFGDDQQRGMRERTSLTTLEPLEVNLLGGLHGGLGEQSRE